MEQHPASPQPGGDEELALELDSAARLIAGADGLIVAAGAGMGVDSGLPDFRGEQGLWRAYPALGRQRLSFWQIANPQAFRRDARLAWGFYGHRLLLYRRTVPHAGFGWLRDWAARCAHGGWVFTSNVDGQFERAGWEEARTVQCHGSIHRLQCLEDCGAAPWPAGGWEPQVDEAACRLTGPMPLCPGCGGLARPNILMFGDDGWQGGHDEQRGDELLRWLRGLQRPVVVEIGAGSDVPTVRHFSEAVWRGLSTAPAQAALVRINPREPQVPEASEASEVPQRSPAGTARASLTPPGAGPLGRAVSLRMAGLQALRALQRRLAPA